MESDLLIALAVNIGSLVTGIAYLSRRVTSLENKINNGLAERVARVDERVNMIWEVCHPDTRVNLKKGTQ